MFVDSMDAVDQEVLQGRRMEALCVTTPLWIDLHDSCLELVGVGNVGESDTAHATERKARKCIVIVCPFPVPRSFTQCC